MSAATIVLLLVAGTNDPAVVAALVEALSTALAPDVKVVQGAPRSTQQGARVEIARGVSGTIEVDWDQRPGATVRVQRADAGWTERHVEFDAKDPAAERARSVGLIAAAIWRAMKPPITEATRPAPPAIPPDAAAIASAPAAVVPPLRVVDAAGVATVGVGGAAGRWGGSVAAQWRPGGRRLGWRLGVDVRIGEIPKAQATAYTFMPALGASYALLRPTRAVGLDLRAGVILVGELVSHFSSDDPKPDRQSRWLPGLDGGFDLTWSVSPGLALLLGGGVEVAGAPTDIVVHEERTATIPAWRLVTRVGLRTRF